MLLSARDLEDRLERVRRLESRLTFRLSVLSKLLDQRAAELLAGAEINLTAYRILNVSNTLGAASISEISRFCGIDRAQVSRTAVELERRGLVEFGEDPASRRKKIVALTGSGRALLAELDAPFVARNAELDALLGPERRQALIEAINLLTEHVRK